GWSSCVLAPAWVVCTSSVFDTEAAGWSAVGEFGCAVVSTAAFVDATAGPWRASSSRIRVSSWSMRRSICRMVSLFESSVDPVAVEGTVVSGVCPVWELVPSGLTGCASSFFAWPSAVLVGSKYEGAKNTKHERTTRRVFLFILSMSTPWDEVLLIFDGLGQFLNSDADNIHHYTVSQGLKN